MDTQTFWNTVEGIADEFNIGRHPLVKLIKEGRATRQQIRQFAVEHYEMTVRDSGHYIAQGYNQHGQHRQTGRGDDGRELCRGGHGPAHHTASHTELLFEFWEKGLGLSRQELEQSSASPAAPGHERLLLAAGLAQGRVLGALGVLEGGFSHACEDILDGCKITIR